MSEKELKAYCNKCGHYGPVTAKGEHLRPSDGKWCNYVAMPSPTPTAEKADVVEDMLEVFRSTPLHGDAGCDKLSDDEWRTIARAAIAALQSRPAEPAVDKIQAVAEGVANIVGSPYEDWRHFTGEAKAILARLETAAEPAGEEPVGEAAPMVGSNGGFTMAAFKASDVPAGTKLYARPAPSNQHGLVEAVRTTIARCEALEDEASNELVKADAEHAQGYWRGQKRTAKSIRRELHDLTRSAISAPALNGEN